MKKRFYSLKSLHSSLNIHRVPILPVKINGTLIKSLKITLIIKEIHRNNYKSSMHDIGIPPYNHGYPTSHLASVENKNKISNLR